MADSMMKSILCVLAIFTSQSAAQGYGNIKDSQPQLIQEYQPMQNLGGYGSGGLEAPGQPQPELLSSYKQPGNGGFGLLNEPQQPLLQQQPQLGGGYNSVPAPGYGQNQGANTFMQPQEVGNYGGGANPVLISQGPMNNYKVPSSSGYGSTGPAYTQTQPLIQPAVLNGGSGYAQPPLVQQSNGYGKPQRQEPIIFKPGHPSPHSSPSYGPAVRPHNHGQGQFGQSQYGQSQYGSINRRPQSYGGRPQQIHAQVPSHLNTYNRPISGPGYGNNHNNNGYGSSAPAVQPRPSY